MIDGTFVWDNHACMPLRPQDTTFLPQLERVRAAGVDVISLNVSFGPQDKSQAQAMLASFRHWIEARPGDYLLVRTVADLEKAKASGLLGVCFDMESMSALDGGVENVRPFYDAGVRWMLVTYNKPNEAGGGCLSDDTGLTEYGRAVVAEMNRVGMVACGSHSSYRTARELIDFSASPVIFSHSNPRAVCDHPRNIPDDLIRACAARGGVVGINGFGPFLGQNDASTEAFVRHVEYALDLVGDDHVGIALDYVFDSQEIDDFIASNPDMFPPELFTGGSKMVEPWRIPEIAQELSRRGCSSSTLGKLLGGNHLRIAKQVWR